MILSTSLLDSLGFYECHGRVVSKVEIHGIIASVDEREKLVTYKGMLCKEGRVCFISELISLVNIITMIVYYFLFMWQCRTNCYIMQC